MGSCIELGLAKFAIDYDKDGYAVHHFVGRDNASDALRSNRDYVNGYVTFNLPVRDILRLEESLTAITEDFAVTYLCPQKWDQLGDINIVQYVDRRALQSVTLMFDEFDGIGRFLQLGFGRPVPDYEVRWCNVINGKTQEYPLDIETFNTAIKFSNDATYDFHCNDDGNITIEAYSHGV